MSIIDRLNNRRNSTYIFIAIGVIFLAIIIFNQLANNPSTYLLKVEQEREQKDLQFKNDPDSPIKKEERADFKGLKYFSLSDDYVVEATFQSEGMQDTLTLVTSTGTDYQVARAGKLLFTLQNQPLELVAFTYLEPGKNDYFVPFRDLTTNVSTYGGGRYLDVPSTTPITIDFNKAYNPYCAYNETFVCPLPPKENKLNVEIRAGELDY